MIGTLLKRITVHTLDRVVERGKASERAPLRLAAEGLDRVRGLVGLDRIDIRLEPPPWDGSTPDQPMWPSDQEKLRKWQIDRGIVKPAKAADAPAPAAAPALEIYYKRGCPYSRAALQLVQEQNLAAKQVDYTDDRDLKAAIRTRSGRKSSPHVFIRDRFIGGFDELRELHESGKLAALLADPSAPAPGGPARAAADDAEEDEGDERELSPRALQARIAEGAQVLLLDVREPSELAQTGILAGAVAIPLGELPTRSGELDAQGVWISYCRSGRRSLQAAELLAQHGFRSVVSLRGGIEAWLAAGGATVPAAEAAAPAKKVVKLTVLHPERSPFEALLLEDADPEGGARLEGQDLIDRVRAVLDECRPLVQADGGDIELLDIVDDVVGVRLTGNCIGCPSSQATLKQGIERKLKQKIGQIKGIRSPQLDGSAN